MSKFTIDGIIFEEILSAIAEDSTGKLLYRLPQLSEATIDVKADTKEAKDRNGVVIKKSYNAKAATLKATNAHLDLNAYAATTGSDKKVASSSDKIQAPKLILVDASETKTTLAVEPIEGTLSVSAIGFSGSMIDTYTLAADSTATDSSFAYAKGTKEISFPTNVDTKTVDKFLVKYEYETDAAVLVENRADKYPKTVKLTVQALCYDECDTETLRLAYIIFPSFQISPETSLQMKTDATFDYTGDAQVAYCAKNKRLYYIVMADDDIQED